ncbi:MAG: tRNA-dihydrouridine synthase family protein [Pseudoflavonifractor sp.]|nr:tRNA-dihydrouridine synthase family protein [Pseudoflavonifractor sp.]
MVKMYVAPMQGLTDAPWRAIHRELYPEAPAEYVTSFIRVEKGEALGRDMRDYLSPLEAEERAEPQAIFRDTAELRVIFDALTREGATRVNLNLGCPFPLQTGRGRGAALLRRPEVMAEVAEMAAEYPGLSMSVKMRLGMEEADEWLSVKGAIERLRPRYVAVHPRTARQQYRGELRLDALERLMGELDAPIVYNGEIREPADIGRALARFPGLAGVMAGRGLVGRPSLLAEWIGGAEMGREERLRRLMAFHERLMAWREEHLCGEAQVLSKMKPFWEYSEWEIGHKAAKAIRKATKRSKYREAMGMIE